MLGKAVKGTNGMREISFLDKLQGVNKHDIKCPTSYLLESKDGDETAFMNRPCKPKGKKLSRFSKASAEVDSGRIL